MQLFSFDYANHHFSVEATPWNGEEVVFVDGEVVSRKRNFGIASEHEYVVPDVGLIKLIYVVNLRASDVNYELWVNEQRVLEAAAGFELSDDDRIAIDQAVAASTEGGSESHRPVHVKSGSLLSLGLVALKLLKAVKVVKVALLASSVAVYSVMFTVEFALALVGVLVFHEYGHLRAMKKFGIPTKGMYLIPFVGGLAVGDAPRTRWEDVYISMMGPVFGLLMTLAFYIVYLITNSHFAGLVASTSALLNLFNLIPVYPLDGGRVVKSLVFSGRNYLALIALLVISALCFVLAWKMGLYFITFFIVIGVIDIVTGWRVALLEDITPLNRYGIWFSVVWYLFIVAMFIGMIMLIASDGLPGSEIATKVLSS